MESIDIRKFFVFSEDDKSGDYRQFHIVCPYVEDGRVSQFRESFRVSGTEEKLIGEAGIEEKKQGKSLRFRDFLLRHVEENGKQFEIRGKQLWLCAKSDA